LRQVLSWFLALAENARPSVRRFSQPGIAATSEQAIHPPLLRPDPWSGPFPCRPAHVADLGSAT